MAPHYSWKLFPDSDLDPEKVKSWIWIQIRIKAKIQKLKMLEIEPLRNVFDSVFETFL